MSRNILLIAYQFYPYNLGGSHRPFRFTEYLRKNDFEVDVIAANQSSLAEKQDDTLAEKLRKSEIRPFYVRAKDENSSPNYYLRVVDTHYRGWKKEFLKELRYRCTKKKYIAAIVTVPPFSMATGIEDIKRILKVPILLDMRDAWSGWNISPYSTYFHHAKIRKMEFRAISSAEKVIVTSEQTGNDLFATHPSIERDKIHVITNSYDGEIQPMRPLEYSGDKIRIGYVGSFYYEPYTQGLINKKWYQKKPYQYLQYVPRKENWLYRSPYFFFRSISLLLELNPEYKDILSLEFIGQKPHWFDEMVREHNIREVVQHKGLMNKSAALQFQRSCDTLLLTSSKVVGGLDYSIAGKTFEYMTMGRPILAFVTPGAQRDLIEKTGIGLICDPDQPMENVKSLKLLFSGKKKFFPNLDEIKKYSLDRTGSQLRSILQQL